MVFEKFLVETKLCSLGCWKRPSQCFAFCCELSLYFCRLTTRHPNFLFCFFLQKKKNPLHANCHKSPLVTILPQHSERDKLSNFFTKEIFMKTAAEAIYFSFLASLATAVLQHILLWLAQYICLSRGVKRLSCRIANPRLGCC